MRHIQSLVVCCLLAANISAQENSPLSTQKHGRNHRPVSWRRDRAVNIFTHPQPMSERIVFPTKGTSFHFQPPDNPNETGDPDRA